MLFCSGLVSLTTPCKLIAPGVAVKGSLSITKSEIYFEMDEEDPENRKIEPKVGSMSVACSQKLSLEEVYFLMICNRKRYVNGGLLCH